MTPAAAFQELLETLDRLKIPYLVCGSLASSVYGLPRATRDIDLVAEIRPDQIAALTSVLSGHFYADANMMRDALARQRAFNVIHFATSYKFDIFPAGSDAYTKSQFERRQLRQFTVEGEEVQFQAASAERHHPQQTALEQSGGLVFPSNSGATF